MATRFRSPNGLQKPFTITSCWNNTIGGRASRGDASEKDRQDELADRPVSTFMCSYNNFERKITIYSSSSTFSNYSHDFTLA